MKITKHEHAALRVEAHDKTLIIDPGAFTSPLEAPANLAAIVLTHLHADHWTPDHLNRLLEAAPGTPIFGPAGVVAAASDFDVTEVSPGDELTAGGFSLRFFGGTHELIHTSIPVIDNVGVLVDDVLYYPGDSYAVPTGVDLDILAAPLGAPWLRINDAIDFVLAVTPRRAFGTHDMTLSEIGRNLHRERLAWATEQGGGEFLVLEPGDTLEA